MRDAATNSFSKALHLPPIQTGSVEVDRGNSNVVSSKVKNTVNVQSLNVDDNDQSMAARRVSLDPTMLNDGDAEITMIGEATPKPPPNRSLFDKLNENEEKKSKSKEKVVGPGKNLRFKRLARMIKTNLRFAHTLKDSVTANNDGDEDKDKDAFYVDGGQEKGELLVFDANSFKAENRSYGGLSNRARKCLMKHPSERSDEDLVLLKDVVERLKCFSKYPRKVKHELARVIFYENVDSGRVIIAQGHIGMSFYFIVSGTVVVKMQETNKETGQKQTTILGELSEGSSFGELALLHNIRRQATIASVTDAELLRVDKDDFETVLRVSYEREWNERLNSLSRLPAFNGLKQEEIVNCNKYCKLKEFTTDMVIFGDTNKAPDYVGFIVSGDVALVRDLTILKDYGKYGKVTYKMPSEKLLRITGREKYNSRRNASLGNCPERHLWTVGIVRAGFCYGIGENLLKTYLICKSRVEVLFVPRVQFIKLGRSRMVERMKEALDRALPTNNLLFKYYFKECEWEKYKRQEVEEIVSRRRIPNHTKTTDVPYAIRVDSWRIGQDKYKH